ncbi:MAG TPA: SDR family oxidoreductase [Pirellulales bacterium]|nr:SDR family oxidoreductase [Pirellulales bacterium]
MMHEPILIVGATSDIAEALCRRLAAAGRDLIVAGRDRDALEALAADLSIRYGREMASEPFEALDAAAPEPFFARCRAHAADGLAGLIVCYGYLPQQNVAEHDLEEQRKTFEINFTSVAALLAVAANYFADRRQGFLAAVSSVAGDRGRQSNYVYGAAKGALGVYLAGLRNRLHPCGVHVLTVKPGFVATKMTAGQLNPRSPLVASPERIAADIERALRRKTSVLYTPWWWRWIMRVICLIPERVFVRLKL